MNPWPPEDRDGLWSVVDPDAVDASLFGEILSLVYDGLVAGASAASD